MKSKLEQEAEEFMEGRNRDFEADYFTLLKITEYLVENTQRSLYDLEDYINITENCLRKLKEGIKKEEE